MIVYDFPCEYCPGQVRERVLDQEPIRHHRGIVILENVPLGVCDRCGARYYPAPVLKRVEAILTSSTPPKRTLEVPIETY